MLKKCIVQRLNELQQCKIIKKLRSKYAPCKRSLARYYNITEGPIRQVWDKGYKILQQSAFMCDQTKEKIFQSSAGHFP